MRTNWIMLGLLILSAAFGAGCNGSDDLVTVAPTGQPTELDGTWSTVCTAQSGTSNYESTSYTFSGTSGYTYAIQWRVFSDLHCSQLIAAVVASGTFSIGSAAVSPSGAKKVDMTQSSMTLTPATGVASQLNSTHTCLNTTFQDGVSTSVAGIKCGETPYERNGTTIYNIYALSGSSLQIGATSLTIDTSGIYPGNSDANRPTNFNSGKTLGKQ
jgi:hypothetical protein